MALIEIDGLPVKKGSFHGYVSHNQRLNGVHAIFHGILYGELYGFFMAKKLTHSKIAQKIHQIPIPGIIGSGWCW